MKRCCSPADLAALKAKGRAASEGWRQTLHQAQAEARRAEAVRLEQQRQRQMEAERQARQRAVRLQTVEQFRELAAKRESKGVGYGDRSKDWKITPEGLRERIDRFNSLPPEGRKRALELLLDPARGRGLEQLQQLMDQRRDLVRGLDRGLGR